MIKKTEILNSILVILTLIEIPIYIILLYINEESRFLLSCFFIIIYFLVFNFWFYSIYSNLHIIFYKKNKLDFSLKWIYFYWLIPFVNLYIYYKIFLDIWIFTQEAANPDASESDRGFLFHHIIALIFFVSFTYISNYAFLFIFFAIFFYLMCTGMFLYLMIKLRKYEIALYDKYQHKNYL